MMRSFALTYAAPTLRLWLFALLIPQLVLGVPFERSDPTGSRSTVAFHARWRALVG